MSYKNKKRSIYYINEEKNYLKLHNSLNENIMNNNFKKYSIKKKKKNNNEKYIWNIINKSNSKKKFSNLNEIIYKVNGNKYLNQVINYLKLKKSKNCGNNNNWSNLKSFKKKYEYF